ncbi:hypothetical protein ACRYI5_03545 [Furfurilactobacillus sp. WILCCON 0119]
MLPTTIFLLLLVTGIMLGHVAANEAGVRALRSERDYWQIQTITKQTAIEHLKNPMKSQFTFQTGEATLNGSQISIHLRSGQTASRHVWERNQRLK